VDEELRLWKKTFLKEKKNLAGGKNNLGEDPREKRGDWA